MNTSAGSDQRSNISALVSLLIQTAELTSHKTELQPRFTAFQGKSHAKQSQDIAGFYLYIEKYIFKNSADDIQRFRHDILKQFKPLIENHSHLEIIFLAPSTQITELQKTFLQLVCEKLKQILGNAEGAPWTALNLQLSREADSDVNHGATDFVRLSHEFFDEVEKRFSASFVLTAYNAAYNDLANSFQNLDTFHVLVRLFPDKALDETKLNLLSIQQIKALLLEKIDSLEKLSREVHQKNEQLEQTNSELHAQSEQLNIQNKALSEARAIIEQKNETLNQYNSNLEKTVEARTRELERANQILTKYNQSLEEHAFAISHHLKAPVARLIGLTHLLSSDDDQLHIEQIYKHIETSARELDQVLNDLVESLNIKKEASHKVIETCDPMKIVKSIAEELKIQYSSNATFTFDSTGSQTLQTDKKYLTLAIRNILDNAFKFRKADQPLHIDVSVNTDVSNMLIRIGDNGVGFPITNEKLFLPFQRFNTSFAGRGVGLYFAKQWIAVLGGTISIESKPMEGTVVSISLPINP